MPLSARQLPVCGKAGVTQIMYQEVHFAQVIRLLWPALEGSVPENQLRATHRPTETQPMCAANESLLLPLAVHEECLNLW